MSAKKPLPTYIEYGPRESSPPPFLSQGGRFLFFDLDADLGKLETLCEEMLNGPAEGRVVYTPKHARVVLLAGYWRGLVSKPILTRGMVNEVQVALMVPLVAKRRGERKAHHAAMLPYVFVDNPVSLINGREDYGYQKSLAQFAVSPLAGENVTVNAYGGEFGRKNVASWVPVLSLKPTTAQPASPGPLEDPEAVASNVASLSVQRMRSRARANALEGFIGGMVAGTSRQVFLKQFRDAEQAGKACYQRIVQVPVKLTVTAARTLYSEWEITVHSQNSHPITTDLGVQNQRRSIAGEIEGSLELKTGELV